VRRFDGIGSGGAVAAGGEDRSEHGCGHVGNGGDPGAMGRAFHTNTDERGRVAGDAAMVIDGDRP
jgi:hypothetical protein